MDLSWPSYLGAIALLFLQTVPVVAAAWYAAEVLVSRERPMLRVATGFLLAILQVVLTLQLTGVAGILSRFPVLVGAWVMAGLVVLVARGIGGLRGSVAGGEAAATTLGVDRSEVGAGSPSASEAGSVAKYVWYGTIVVLVFATVTALVSALVKPSFATDTVNYHLPIVGNWVRDHSIWTMRQWQFSVFQNGYPLNSELTAAWFVIPFGRDFLVNLAPLVQAAFVVAAVAALAEQLGCRARDALLIGATGLFVPIVATAGIGSLGSDLLPMAGWVLSLAFVLGWRRTEDPVDLALGGLALGLALGAKITGTIYAVVFAASFLTLVLWRKRWLQGLVLLPLAIALPAAVWYLRNIFLEGNPVWGFPLLDFRSGYWRDNGDDWSVWQYLVRGGPEAVVRVVVDYVAGLFFVAPLLVLGVPGWLRTLRGDGDGIDRARLWLLGGMPLLGLAITWAMPWTGGNDGYNVPASGRYVAGTFAILLAAAMSGALRGRRPNVWRVALLVTLAAGVAVSYLSPLLSTYRMATRGIAAGVLAALVAVVVLAVRERRGGAAFGPRVARGAVAAGLLAFVAISLISAPKWSANWYRQGHNEELAALYRVIQDRPVSGARIAVAGLAHGYPLQGKDLSNEVVWVGSDDIGSPWGDTDRAAWLEALGDSCTDYLVVLDDPDDWLSPVQEVSFVESDTDGLEPILVDTAEMDGEERLIGLWAISDLPARCR